MYVLRTSSIRLINKHNGLWAMSSANSIGMTVFGSYWKNDRAIFVANYSSPSFSPKIYKTQKSARAVVTRILNKHVSSLDDLADFTIDIVPFDQLP